jgi:hypothetical protein
MAEKKVHASEPVKHRRGRPRLPSRMARPNRVVTFVTDQELQFLTQTVVEEDRSLASVVHRIIAAHINEN